MTNSLRTIVDDYCLSLNGLHVMHFSDGNRLINSLRFRSSLEKFSVNVHRYNQLMAAYRVYMRLTDETYCVHVEAGRTNLLSRGLAFVWMLEFSYTLILFSLFLSLFFFKFTWHHSDSSNVRVTILATKLAYARTKQLGQVFSTTSHSGCRWRRSAASSRTAVFQRELYEDR